MNSRSDNVLVFTDLQRITGYQRRSDVERSLVDQGVRLFRGRTGPWTTLDLINQAAGMKPAAAERYDADIL
ncbi:hypothetical protein G7021_00980 [Pseudomonas carnis]|jgi:hypothetical protein|uniref:DUF4224 domain-containing protein n=3 Tax=Pseudomonas TaxID=286 RepID=A0A1H6LA93_9PSED|nr:MULTISPECIES: hypothetical protein [Pseudomonas]AZE58716.1 hypothetical protein C4K02_0322 [Pseudomonas synxantha]KIR23430.1 hypothetical protein PFLU3_12140 [Pseudomonas fluorescens]KWV83085.1 hypothetical protein PFL603g_01239 [Pseudomonas fluorescens]MBA1251226.1 hypothetical protein [Pseudomonas carnis]MBA1265995.1 hypothetical protein [Pseudomonas carnis]